jgi:hypothetical protein
VSCYRDSTTFGADLLSAAQSGGCGSQGRREYRDSAGRLHREDGPALIHANGSVKWYRHGKRHRLGAPACVYVNGTRKWYRDGLRHRDGGPASTYPDGRRIWFENGVKVRQETVEAGRVASIRDGGEG